MEKQADVVSAGRLTESLSKALPELETRARFESAEMEGSRELIKRLQSALPIIAAEREAPGVMVTFRDQTSSQLQTFLAKQAAQDGNKLEVARPGGLEASSIIKR